MGERDSSANASLCSARIWAGLSLRPLFKTEHLPCPWVTECSWFLQALAYADLNTSIGALLAADDEMALWI